jgi:8-oxo-dGTP pyrophosphatase MutT (NUDIX family)
MTGSLISLSLSHVRQALALPDFDVFSAWRRMAPPARSWDRQPGLPGSPKPAGVLLLLYPLEGVLSFVLTRRTENVATHKGQISLPGGAQETGETSSQTSLRETWEEIGVHLDDSCLIGSLTPLYVSASDFTIHPFVGYVSQRPAFTPDPVEVAGIIEIPLALLLDDSIKAVECWFLRGEERDVPLYRMYGQGIWGATAVILSELEWRLREVLSH